MESKKIPRKRVGDMNPEELKAYRTYELLKKQRQRARARGVTLEEYRSRIADSSRVQVESSVRADNEAKSGAERMRNLRDDLGKDVAVQEVRDPPQVGGGEASKNFEEVRRAVGKHIRSLPADDWNRMVDGGLGRGALKNLEIRKDYTKFGGDMNKWSIRGGRYRDPALFLDKCRSLVERAVLDAGDPSKKVSIVLTVELAKISLSGETREVNKPAFRSNTIDLGSRVGLNDEDWRGMVSTVLGRVSNHQAVGSGWILEKIVSLFVNVDKYGDLDGMPEEPLIQRQKEVGRRKDPPPSD